MSADPIAVLSAIVAEVAGAGQPFSADSFLPPHLIHDAREAIEFEVPTTAKDAHVELLLARLRKADETIVALRSEIDHLRRSAEETERKLSALAETNAELDRKMESSMSKPIPGCPPESLQNTGRIVFDPYDRLTAYGRRQECDS